MPLARAYSYCMHCGVALDLRARCPQCGARAVRRPTPAVAMAVVESHEVLLVRRRWAPMVGHWGLPAGYVEKHESPWRTVRREVREETGLIVRPVGIEAALRGGGQDGPVILVVFAGVVEGGSLQAGDDATDVGFFPLTRLPEPLAYGPHRVILERLRKLGGWTDATPRTPGGPHPARA